MAIHKVCEQSEAIIYLQIHPKIIHKKCYNRTLIFCKVFANFKANLKGTLWIF
ncbi:hypothetical protein ACWIUD_03365 [Helicobacter sp. 23-1044]